MIVEAGQARRLTLNRYKPPCSDDLVLQRMAVLRQGRSIDSEEDEATSEELLHGKPV
jgi:hypothetical protein